MAIVDSRNLTPRQAVDYAKKHFDELFEGERLQSVLLEGLDYDEEADLWEVTISFDIGQTLNKGIAALASEFRPLRESRRFVLRGTDGALVRMEDIE